MTSSMSADVRGIFACWFYAGHVAVVVLFVSFA